MIIRPGDVVFCNDYQISNDARASRHPCIILSIENWLIAVVCTDARNAAKFSRTVPIDYKFAGLCKPTVAICSKALLISPGYITRIIGRVRVDDYDQIYRAVADRGVRLNLIESRADYI